MTRVHSNPDAAALAIAEKVLTVLELGSFSATYKYALFIAILDLCIECSSPDGPPDSLTTEQLAAKVVELYWPHAVPYEGSRVLRQGGGRDGNQAEILRAIARFRERHARDPSESAYRARLGAPDEFQRLLATVEWKLVEMPIPRLQRVGRVEDRFLYEYGWDASVRQAEVLAKHRGKPGSFDNLIRFLPGVADALVRLNGILRPIVKREWAAMVSSMNDLPESRLETFLFGVERVALAPVRGPLRELQGARCFYCSDSLREPGDVDHFIPWSRYPDNGLDNLVVAHQRCNNAKRDFLAAEEHVEELLGRNERYQTQLAELSSREGWSREPARSRAVGRALYARLPEDALVWRRREEMVRVDRGRVLRAFDRAT